MICPDVQYPHWNPSQATNAAANCAATTSSAAANSILFMEMLLSVGGLVACFYPKTGGVSTFSQRLPQRQSVAKLTVTKSAGEPYVGSPSHLVMREKGEGLPTLVAAAPFLLAEADRLADSRH
jgi:hypothetical protein